MGDQRMLDGCPPEHKKLGRAFVGVAATLASTSVHRSGCVWPMWPRNRRPTRRVGSAPRSIVSVASRGKCKLILGQLDRLACLLADVLVPDFVHHAHLHFNRPGLGASETGIVPRPGPTL